MRVPGRMCILAALNHERLLVTQLLSEECHIDFHQKNSRVMKSVSRSFLTRADQRVVRCVARAGAQHLQK